jgi:murein DD-endopeptidase MepM/ murein hydrolase activator NlpD
MAARSPQESPTELLVAVRSAAESGSARRRSRTTPDVSRRPALLLTALLVGGLAAAGWGVGAPQASAEATSVLEAQQALLTGEEGLEVKPQASVTMAEAEARLQDVAASRAARAEEEAAAAAAAVEAARPKTVLPVAGARLTSTFGSRWGRMHEGIDLAAPMRTPEYAAADGVVLRAGPASGYGQVVYILHEGGEVTVYGHMIEILVEPGQYVDAGETIALLGNEGRSTGPHLHFEVRVGGEDGERIDPIGWLNDRGVDV